MIAKYRQQGVEGWILTDFTMEQIENELANLGELKQCEKAHTYNVKYHVLCPICTEHKLRRELEQVKRERDEWKTTCIDQRQLTEIATQQLSIERKRADDNETLLYKSLIKFGHKKIEDCSTWYDGCNCIIPYDDFDSIKFNEVRKAQGGIK